SHRPLLSRNINMLARLYMKKPETEEMGAPEAVGRTPIQREWCDRKCGRICSQGGRMNSRRRKDSFPKAVGFTPSVHFLYDFHEKTQGFYAKTLG
ncbi:hypothetical protein, partial [Thiolapillus sp.]